MDLHNNEVGRDIGLTATDRAAAVLEAPDQAHLVKVLNCPSGGLCATTPIPPGGR